MFYFSSQKKIGASNQALAPTISRFGKKYAIRILSLTKSKSSAIETQRSGFDLERRSSGMRLL
jgi:hypothetical protein